METEEYFEKERKDAKTYKELLDSAYLQFQKEESIDNYLKAIDIYDIDSTMNNKLLLLELKNNYHNLEEDLEKYINTLTLTQKKYLINEIYKKNIRVNNIILTKKSNKEIYFDMLKIIDEGDLGKFDKLFRQSCTCQIEHFKIPLIYGEEELHYAFLLNHLYQNMAYHRKEPSQENNLGKGSQYT